MSRFVIVQSGWYLHLPGQPEGNTPAFYIGKLDDATGEVVILRRILSDAELKTERERLAPALGPQPEQPKWGKPTK